MRIGIFSDVHANIEALTAVVEAYRGASIDKFVCLGDVVGYGAQPEECCDIVREIADFTILGNHDAAVAGRMDYSYYYDAARNALDVHRNLLSEHNMDWLRSLPYSRQLERLSFCHGSPINIEEFEYIFSPAQAALCLPVYGELGEVTFIGHSHLCKAFALTADDVFEVVATDFEIRPGHKYIISVGSVGQPRDYDTRSSYTIYDTETKRFEFKRIPYDIDAAAQKIYDMKLERNFGNRLFMGDQVTDVRFVAPELLRLDACEANALVLTCFSDERPLRGTAGLVDWRLSGRLSRMLENRTFIGRKGERVLMSPVSRFGFRQIVLHGLGHAGDFNEHGFREAALEIRETQHRLRNESYVLQPPGRSEGRLSAPAAKKMWDEVAQGDGYQAEVTLVEPIAAQKEILLRG